MDTANINEPCAFCQRRETVLNTYAFEVAGLEVALEESLAMCASYREQVSVLLEQLSSLTVAQKHQRDRIAALLAQLRRLRGGLQLEERAA